MMELLFKCKKELHESVAGAEGTGCGETVARNQILLGFVSLSMGFGS